MHGEEKQREESEAKAKICELEEEMKSLQVQIISLHRQVENMIFYLPLGIARCIRGGLL